MTLDDLKQDQLPTNAPGGDDSVAEPTVPVVEPGQDSTSQAELESLREQLARSKSDADNRLASLENLLLEMARMRTAPTPNLVEPLDWDNDPAAGYKLAKRELSQEIERVRQESQAQMAAVRQRELNANMQRIGADNPEVIKRFQSDIDKYYRDFPNERYNPDSYATVVQYYKGQLYDEDRNKRRPTAPPTGFSPVAPTGPSSRPAPQKPALSDDERRLAIAYGMFDGNKTDEQVAEEWITIREDRVKYPGKRAGR